MSYRTQSLFHYTQSIDSIMSIIHSMRLIPNYCKEDLSTDVNENYYWGIPMVCFCDIPLSKAQELRDNYGQYAIAFDKNWGIRNDCNPVQYVSNESIINSAIYSLDRLRELKEQIRELKSKVRQKGELDFDFTAFLRELDDGQVHNFLLGYVKKYMGEWKGKPYCNYNENEWRYVLKDGENDVEWLFKEDYDKWRGDSASTPKPKPAEELKDRSLHFYIDDIKHIVLSREDEIPGFITELISSEASKEISKAKCELLTKITSFERISTDF